MEGTNLSATRGVSDVESYLAKVPEPARHALEQVRAVIQSVVPRGATEILSYGIPTYRHNGRNVVSYAAFKNHCSLFPLQASLIDEMSDELKEYRTAKGTLRFRPDTPFPAALLRKIVKARLAYMEREKRSGTRSSG